MKKNLVMMLMLLLASTAMIQAQDGLSVQLGFASPTFRLNSPVLEDKAKLETTALNGFRVAIAYDASFYKGLGVMMGIDYTISGNHTKWESVSTYGEYPRSRTRNVLNQAEIFVDWQYKFEVAMKTYLIVYTGPTVQWNINMRQTEYTQNFVGDDGTKKIVNVLQYNNEKMQKYYQRYNVTWGVGLGFQYERYFIRGGYDFGLINPYHFDNFDKIGYPDRNTRGRLDQWQVKVGVYLWESK